MLKETTKLTDSTYRMSKAETNNYFLKKSFCKVP